VDGEAPLDVEYSGAMSNSYGSYLDTAHIYEYEMPNGLYATYADAFNQIVSDDYAKVVSTSYGWEENVGFSGSVATGTMHPIFNSMVGTGWTLIASAGDNGSSDGCADAIAVDYPASDSDFLAAGGTQLLLDSSGIYVSETAWVGETWSGACGSNHGGGGGGLSVLFGTPYWQSPLGYGMRAMPDISLTANPDVMGQWYYSGGSWQDEGGTSIVAPELAGFVAQENSYLDYIGNICGSGGTSPCSPVGLANPWFYYAPLAARRTIPFTTSPAAAPVMTIRCFGV
jgi:subtilase family serine protease